MHATSNMVEFTSDTLVPARECIGSMAVHCGEATQLRSVYAVVNQHQSARPTRPQCMSSSFKGVIVCAVAQPEFLSSQSKQNLQGLSDAWLV